jgi:hypothetical protein
MIFDEHLATLSPSACKVLILPDSECLSDNQIASIRDFVEAGGGLIVTEQAGLYDEWRRSRITPGLKGLVDNQVRGSSYEESVKQAAVAMGVPSRKEVGRGRVYYIPGLEFDGPLPPNQPYFSIDNSFWKRPKNWKQLVDGITWVSQGDIPLMIEGPDYLVANLVEQPHRSRRFVHLINFNFKHIPSIQNVEMRCAVPDLKPVTAVRVYSAESESPTDLPFQIRNRMVLVTIPHINAYCMVEIS